MPCAACAAKAEMVRFLHAEVDLLRAQVGALFARDGMSLPRPAPSAPQGLQAPKKAPKKPHRPLVPWSQSLAADGHVRPASLMREVEFAAEEAQKEAGEGPTPAGYVEQA